jgi:uncharacterized protein
MRITYDEAKRAAVLDARGLDLADAGEAFAGFHLTRADDKHSDDEDRYHTLGMIRGRLVLIVWTKRDGDRRIITMWEANERERRNFERVRSASA